MYNLPFNLWIRLWIMTVCRAETDLSENHAQEDFRSFLNKEHEGQIVSFILTAFDTQQSANKNEKEVEDISHLSPLPILHYDEIKLKILAIRESKLTEQWKNESHF